MNNLNESLAAFREVEDRFSSATGVERNIRLATATHNEGLTLAHLGRKEEALAVLDSVIARFGSATDLKLHERVASSLLNKGVLLFQLERKVEAFTVYDEVITRFGSATEMTLREIVAQALFGKGIAEGLLGHREEAISIYDEVMAKIGLATGLKLREQFAKAGLNKAVELGRLRRKDEAIALYDDIIARFGSATEISMRVIIARAQINKALELVQLAHIEEAITIYDEIVARFASAAELPFSELHAEVLKKRERAERFRTLRGADKELSDDREGANPRIGEQLDNLIANAAAETPVKITTIGTEMAGPPSLRPLIVYDHSAERRNRGDGNLYTHIWFRNEPNGGVARDVVARISWTCEADKGLFAVDAKWQEVPYDLGRPAIYAANRVNFLSDGTKHALDLCIRKPNGTEFYALDIEAPNRDAFGQDRRLQPGIYTAFVELSCEGYSGSFRFKVQKDRNEPPQVTLLASY